VSHWPFILGAYGFAGIATLLLVAQSFASMRGAEAEADGLRGEK
jgi:hypothetical protein